MTTADYGKILRESQQELEELLIKQEEIERRIARLKQAILALTPLAEQDIEEGVLSLASGMGLANEVIEEWLGTGITGACREIFKAVDGPLSPVEIKERLIKSGINLSGQKNIMASIHSALKRLVKSGEIGTSDSGLTYKGKRRLYTDAPAPATSLRNMK